jgi:hypothetical protein
VTVVTSWLAWLAFATPVIVIALHILDQRRERELAARLGELPAVQRMMAARSPWRRTFKAVLLALGLGLVVFAAARPQVLGSKTSTRESMDLVIAIDASKSMLVGDVEVAQPPGGWPQDLPDDAPRPVPEWARTGFVTGFVPVVLAMLLAWWLARSAKRRASGSWPWRLFGAPMDVEPVRQLVAAALWNGIKGAAPVERPETIALSRRFCEVLQENLGQPGFREVVTVATDLDARRDIVAALRHV